MGSREQHSSDNGGFNLTLRHGGRISKTKASYVGGKMSSFQNMDVNEWGLFTLRDKVKELGYEHVEELKMFVNRCNELTELLTDIEVWDLLKEIELNKRIEIWVVSCELNTCEGETDGVDDSGSDCDGDSDEGEWESDGDSDADDIEFDINVDPTAEFPGIEKQHPDLTLQSDGNIEINFSDEGSEKDSDIEEQQEYKLPNFRGQTEMETPKFCLGLTFGSKEEFKEAVYNYAMCNGRELLYVKNDKVRCIVECNEVGCPFRINLRKQAADWRITTMCDKHEGCCWSNVNYMANSTTVGKRWKTEVASHATWTPSEFLKKVSSKDGITISKRQAYRALKKARAALYGEEEKCFNKLWGYCLEIERTNPGSTYDVKLSDLKYDGKEKFVRFYMCWKACIEGYKYCRPIIGVDGCHLKGLHGGQLLLAIGVDGNDSVFPLAYAVVEGETKESWTWFLKHLKKDLSITPQDELELTFISDKQKGLLPAFEHVLPAVSHRFCVRHLHGNMKQAGFTGKAIKDGLWEAARATTVNSFTAAMKKFKDIDAKAYEWLCDKHPSEWSRSHFSTTAHCDMLVNNICECYNAVILDAREQPLLSCLETVRKKLMHRLFECRKQAMKWTEPICPRIVKKIDANEKAARGYTVIQSDDNLFETRGVMHRLFEQHEVDLGRMTCTCRGWELSGIPCRHAISAIWMKHGNGPVYDYVHPCYFVDTYLKSYGGSIRPMEGPNEWPESDKEPPLPPLYTAKPGRPKKLRKKGGDEVAKVGKVLKRKEVRNNGGEGKSKVETHLNRAHVKMHCTKCKKEGHNKRKCPDDPTVRERMDNPKKRVRVKTKKGPLGASSSTGPSSTNPMPLPLLVGPMLQPLPTDPMPQPRPTDPEQEDDDTWLANIDLDAVVSQHQVSTQVTYDEIAITSQPPTVEDTQGQVSNSLTKHLAKKKEVIIQRRRYNTRNTFKTKFQNTSDDPVGID